MANTSRGISARPRLLDLFCCAGGAAEGYSRAGFEVVGVDIKPQPHYPFEFWRFDAVEILEYAVRGIGALGSGILGPFNYGVSTFDVIHASPPCQAYSDLKTKLTWKRYPKLIAPVRDLLRATGKPYVIENVEGAPLHDPVMLCGTMFPGLRVLRHRLFETNFPLVTPPHGKHPLVFTHDKRKAHYGQLDQDTAFVQVTGGGNCTVANKRAAMEIDWMTGAELNEAIPPAYTHWIGTYLMAEVERRSELEMAA